MYSLVGASTLYIRNFPLTGDPTPIGVGLCAIHPAGASLYL
jgi:hypothetical protein